MEIKKQREEIFLIGDFNEVLKESNQAQLFAVTKTENKHTRECNGSLQLQVTILILIKCCDIAIA